MSNSRFLRAITNPSKAPKLVTLAIFLLALVIIIVFDFNGLYGQDTHEYFRMSQVIADYLLGKGEMEGFYWTIMYPLLGALLQILTGESPYVLQAISLLSHLGSVIILLKYTGRNYSEKSAILFIVIGYAFCPVMLKDGFLVMSESLTVFFLCGSIYYYNRYKKTSKLNSLIYWFFFVAFALFTRYPVFILLIPQGISVFVKIVKTGKHHYLAIGLTIIVLISLPEMLISVTSPEGGGLFDNYFLQNWSILNLFRSSFLTADGTQVYTLLNLFFVSKLFWYPVFFSPFLLLLFWSKAKNFFRSEQLVLTSSVILYLVFAAGFPFQNIRILVLAFPFLIILGINPFVSWYKWMKSAGHEVICNYGLLLVLFAQISLFFYLISGFAKRNHFEKEVAKYVESLDNKRFFGYDLDVSVNSYLGDTKRIENLIIELHEFKDGDVLLFNKAQYDRVWTKSNVQKNLQRALYRHDTIRIHSFENSWTVYELKERE